MLLHKICPIFFCVCVCSDFCPSENTSLIQFSACKLNFPIFSQTNYFSLTPSFTARVVLPWPISGFSAYWCVVSCKIVTYLEPFEALCPLGIYLRINFPHSFLSLVYIFISWPVFTVEHRLDCHASGVPNTLLDTFSCHLILRRTCQQWNLSGS